MDLVDRIREFARKLLLRVEISEADLDELFFLVDFAGPDLPSQVHDIVASNRLLRPPPALRHEQVERIARLVNVYADLPNRIRMTGFEKLEDEDALIPRFDLSKADKERVLKLCIDMRKIVFATSEFDEPHRLRLLNRIAAIESEVHKPKGMFDVVRGGLNDLGETLGKFGKDIKPLTERMKEVVDITRRGTKQYDQLPAPEEVKQLPAPNPEDSAEQQIEE